MTKTQQPSMRLSRWHERWLYVIGLWVFLSGAGWLVDHHLFAGAGDIAEAPAASEPLWLRLHGAAAMAALMVFGSLVPGHIVRAWRTRKNLRSGLSTLSLVMVLVVTGYGLYYSGDEQARPWISLLHWGAGVLAALVLALHVRLGKRASQRQPLVSDRRMFDAEPSSTGGPREALGRGQPVERSLS
jgi:hypothetical protein